MMGRPPPVSLAIRMPLPRLRRWLFGLLVALTSLFGIGIMVDILRAGGIGWLEGVVLVLFAVTFSWITLAFWTAVIGFVLQWLRRDPLSLRPVATPPVSDRPTGTRTAIVMPVHNEEPVQVMAGLEAVHRSLEATGLRAEFDIHLLSDTTDPDIAAAERGAWAALLQRLQQADRFYYRRRSPNTGRKAGNIADFCQRWGGHYEFLIILDADSLMSGETLVELVRTLQANPSAGLIQTVPIPVRQTTLFGRLMQFAASLYNPMLATGMSFWQTDAANYWGHNAILRMRAFTAHCGLPVLSGRPPLGGEILSHDFVEAALLRRAGWGVHLLPSMTGSYEEMPGNLIDYAKRDRRWAQGNLQHLRLLFARAWHPLNRWHFLLGATAYLASLFWLLILLLGTGFVLSCGTGCAGDSGRLWLHAWPVERGDLLLPLLAITFAFLLLPKVLGAVLALRQRPQAFGGPFALVSSAALEMLFALLTAPVMMVFHSVFVIGVLAGRNVRWGAQVREGRRISWREAIRHGFGMTLIGVLWTLPVAWYSPGFLLWLLPVLSGLLLAVPLIRWTSSPALGRWSRRRGLWLCPEECRPTPVLITRATVQPPRQPLPVESWPLLPEHPCPMAVQRI